MGFKVVNEKQGVLKCLNCGQIFPAQPAPRKPDGTADYKSFKDFEQKCPLCGKS